MDLEQPTALSGPFRQRLGPQAAADRRRRQGPRCACSTASAWQLLAENERTAAAVRAVVQPISDQSRSARVWVDGARVGLADAVLANAVAVHAQFHDDSENDSWTHPGSFIIPVATALGELADAPLSTMLNGIAVGYSATTWLGAKERIARALIDRGIRTSLTLGTIGAAATAARCSRSIRCSRPMRSVSLRASRAACSSRSAAVPTSGACRSAMRPGADCWRRSLAQRGVLGSPQGLRAERVWRARCRV